MFVISKNLARRRLSESQRALVAAKIANLKQGGQPEPANWPVHKDRLPPGITAVVTEIPGVSQAGTAEHLNVSERSVRSAKLVLERGSPELVAAVEEGRVAALVSARFDG